MSGQGLSAEEREALDQSLADSGCHGFLGDHPDLYATVGHILAARLAQVTAERDAAEAKVVAVRAALDGWQREMDVEQTESATLGKRWPSVWSSVVMDVVADLRDTLDSSPGDAQGGGV